MRQAVLTASVRAFEHRTGRESPLETIDLSLPHWCHPNLGLLAVSTANFDHNGIHQTGHKPGAVGLVALGVVLRAVGDQGTGLPPDVPGRLEVLLPGRASWIDTGRQGWIDRDGFVTLLDTR
jgi:hypothetical protein